jgi:hypothetical protein
MVLREDRETVAGAGQRVVRGDGGRDERKASGSLFCLGRAVRRPSYGAAQPVSCRRDPEAEDVIAVVEIPLLGSGKDLSRLRVWQPN